MFTITSRSKVLNLAVKGSAFMAAAALMIGGAFAAGDKNKATGTATLVRGARLVVIKGGPHCITWTHADEVNAELLAFVKR